MLLVRLAADELPPIMALKSSCEVELAARRAALAREEVGEGGMIYCTH